ncbi:type II toxin-antitoxin system RelE/ParE family toxin [Nostoc sp. CHAB 5836]|uniref:type II toxin-antitoxin system RelE/ParE family toxin n=1 Tax=Nostoc sp. CHAB 5836 TaxID=2780404 RepID=UPI002271E467|nr:type II toxin-antitoxin system RelE/ParE family toxin [Nostoc sp. CHAB 5836]MCC5617950.1 type II toxin-antitoxin system RelE/ParE family toxin [Nostoc sp. CHAB 5836]
MNDPDAAARAVQAIVSSGESLEQNPRRGAIVDEIVGLRKLLVSFGKYGFIIHYVILEDDVVILRIYHGRENRPR